MRELGIVWAMIACVVLLAYASSDIAAFNRFFPAAMLLLGAALLYFAPLIIAASRRHPQANPIAVINIFLGWTFVGWVVALAWASSALPDSPQPGTDDV